jgi:hypothetical protein
MSAERVEGDVEREQPGRLDPKRHPIRISTPAIDEVVDELVEEGRVERVRADVLRRPVPVVDLQAPGEIGGLP